MTTIQYITTLNEQISDLKAKRKTKLIKTIHDFVSTLIQYKQKDACSVVELLTANSDAFKSKHVVSILSTLGKMDRKHCNVVQKFVEKLKVGDFDAKQAKIAIKRDMVCNKVKQKRKFVPSVWTMFLKQQRQINKNKSADEKIDNKHFFETVAVKYRKLNKNTRSDLEKLVAFEKQTD